MTGYYVRIKRDDGSFANVEIDQMSDTELDRFIDDAQQHQSSPSAWNWVRALARWVRDNVNRDPE